MPVPSQRCPARLAKIASVAPRSVALGQGDDVLGVRRRLEAGERAALVARPRHGHDGRGRRRARLHRGRHDDQRRRVVAAPGAQRRRAGRVGDPQPPQRPRRALEEPPPRAVRRPGRAPAGRARRRVRTSRSRCRVSANGWPSTTLIASKTPSPTVNPWSVTGDRRPGRVGQQLTVHPGAHALTVGVADRCPSRGNTRRRTSILVRSGASATVLTHPAGSPVGSASGRSSVGRAQPCQG